jgi:isocitrate/isopropylmalate dehydrogenase
MSSRTIRLAVVGGDGIGPEVTAEALKVLRAATPGVSIDETSYDLGARRWHRTGETLPDAVLEEIRGHDAILLGAVGDAAFSCDCASSSTTTSTSARSGCTPGSRPRWPPPVPRRWTWSSSARAPRARTPEPAA